MYYALIDSLAAEHSARMQAMEAATKNAKNVVNSLTVEYNKSKTSCNYNRADRNYQWC